MKRLVKLCLTLGLLGVSPQMLAEVNYPVWCVGGPFKPAYAFTDYGAAIVCRDVVASESRSCQQSVRVGRCQPFNYRVVNSVGPRFCQCAPGPYSIGRWLGWDGGDAPWDQ